MTIRPNAFDRSESMVARGGAVAYCLKVQCVANNKQVARSPYLSIPGGRILSGLRGWRTKRSSYVAMRMGLRNGTDAALV